DHRVGAGFGDFLDRPRGFFELVFEDKSIESDVAAHTAAMQRPHYVGQFGQRKTDFGASGKVLQPEIDSVGAGFDGSVQLRPISGGAHDFGLAHFFFQDSPRYLERAISPTAPLTARR